MLVQPSSHVVAMEADTCARAGDGSAGTAEPTNWENLVAEYANVFEPPGMPAERDTVHRIKVQLGSGPPYRQQYCISAAKIMEIWQYLDKYLEKGWIRPSCLPYGAPIVFIHKKTGELRMTVNY